jgi:hypothetical protein
LSAFYLKNFSAKVRPYLKRLRSNGGRNINNPHFACNIYLIIFGTFRPIRTGLIKRGHKFPFTTALGTKFSAENSVSPGQKTGENEFSGCD